MTLGLFGNDLSSLIRKIVKEELNQPVKGLTPGIHASPSITLDAAGRIRHIEAGSGGGASVALWMHKANPNNISSGATIPVDFDYIRVNTGTLTTGSNWRWAPAADGVFLVTTTVAINPGANPWVSGQNFQMHIDRWNGSGYDYWSQMDKIYMQSGEGTRYMQGSCLIYITTAKPFAIMVHNPTGSTHTIDADGDGGTNFLYTTKIPGMTNLQVIPISVL